MNRLLRELAPVSKAAWEEIEKEAKRTLKAALAARRFVDFDGPKGWDESAVASGRIDAVPSPTRSSVQARLRRVHPLIELRAPFAIAKSELEAIDRGAKDPDLTPVIEAAKQIALAEDSIIFNGYRPGGVLGICKSAEDTTGPLESYEDYPAAVAAALDKLRSAGVGGPFALALSERFYIGLNETTSGGYPVIEHVRKLISGPIMWAPALEGAVLLSTRGGDFELVVGQDFSIGYLEHDSEEVRCYIEESMTFRLLAAQAAVTLQADRPTRRAARAQAV